MKSHRALLKTVLAALAACSAGLAAADTQDLTVSATISATCKFSSSAQTLSFGTVDPSGTSAISASGAAVKYKCTNGTSAAGVTHDGGSHNSGGPRMANAGSGEFIPYTLTISNGTQTGTGFGAGQDKNLTVDGSISASNFQNVSAGAYSDTVVLTISP